jgi:hypothetical protein
MVPVEITSRVDADGVLGISLPIGADEANREVKVIVEPLAPRSLCSSPTREEWQEFVRTMAGCISDPTFQRPDQGEYERRPHCVPAV